MPQRVAPKEITDVHSQDGAFLAASRERLETTVARVAWAESCPALRLDGYSSSPTAFHVKAGVSRHSFCTFHLFYTFRGLWNFISAPFALILSVVSSNVNSLPANGRVDIITRSLLLRP